MSAALLADLKRRLAETLTRSRLDYSDEVMTLTAFWTDFHRQAKRPAQVRRAWKELLEEGPAAGRRMRLEVNFPFCAQKCLYCFLGTRVSSPAVHASYLAELYEEMAYFAPVVGDARFQSLQLGHGTPTILGQAELAELCRRIRESYRFAPGAALSVEAHPASVDRAKIGLLREHGFSEISFGVESTDPAVLAAMRRGSQRFEMVEDAVRWSREAGFPAVNLDLVFGLDGEPVEGFLEGFARVAALKPSSITVCNLTLTDAYTKTTGVTRPALLRLFEKTVPRALEGLREIAARENLDTGELTPDQGIWKVCARDGREAAERRGRDYGDAPSLLGLGLRARSHVFGRLLYQRRPKRWAAGAEVYGGRALSEREEMTRYVLQALNLDSRVDFAAFRRWFGRDLRETFSRELGVLRAWGKVREDARGVSFLPVLPAERVFYASVFMLDTLSRSPYSAGRLGAPFLKKLDRLEEVAA